MNRVYIQNGGSVANGSAAETGRGILGVTVGVDINGGSGAAGTVTNYGSIGATGAASTGVADRAGGSVLNGSTLSTGWQITGALYGISMLAGNGAVGNYGTVRSTGTTGAAINIGGSGIITNGAGTPTTWLIEGVGGIFVGNNGTVVNDGTVLGTGIDGVYIQNGGSVANGSAAETGRSILGVAVGVDINGGNGATGIVTNYGSIGASGAASTGVADRAGGSVLNGSTLSTGWQITGALYGISMLAGNGAVGNYGTVRSTGTTGAAINIGGSGIITNGAGTPTTWLIEGVGGIFVGNNGTVVNDGTVLGTGIDGVYIQNGGSVANGSAAETGRSILGVAVGVDINGGNGATGIVTNYGSIGASGTASTGVADRAGGSVSNGSTASSIIGGLYGVSMLAGTGIVKNFGTIRAMGTNGIGIDIAGAGSTVLNAGTVGGGGGTAVLLGGGSGRVIVDPGAVFNGKVSAVGGGNVLELASAGSVGTISAFGTSFNGFQTIAVDAGAKWVLSGPVSGSSVIELGATSDLTLTGTTSAEIVFAAGTIGTVSLLAPGDFTGTLAGLSNGDIIDFVDTAVTEAAISGTTLLVTSGTTTYRYALNALLPGSQAITTTDPAGTGTDVIIAPTALPPAAAQVNTASPINFGNVRIGATPQTTLSVTNVATVAGAALDATIFATGAATAIGTISQLGVGQTDTSDLTVGLNATSAGLDTGTVAIDFTSVTNGGTATALPTQSLTVEGTVYGLAAGLVTAPSGLIFHVGDSGTADLSVVNNVAAGADYEGLRATVTGSTGVSATGATGQVAPGAANASTLSFSVPTSAAGVKTGTIDVALESDGTGTDGDLPISLGTVAVPVSVQINNYATPGLLATDGTFTGSGTAYTLNLGTALEGEAALSVQLLVANEATGPADTLSGDVSPLSASGFVNTGNGAFTGLAAGGTLALQTITLSTGGTGSFSENFVLDTTDSNAGGYSSVEAATTLTVTGTILYQPLPELTVSDIIAPGTALTGQLIPITWTDDNDGPAAASGPWVDEVFLASDSLGDNLVALGTFAYDGTLAAGGTLSRTETLAMPATLSGNQWVVVQTDAASQVAEPGTAPTRTTVATTPIDVTALPAPDLVVTSITPPTAAYSGQATTIAWTVKNAGVGGTSAAAWTDDVFLSLGQTLEYTSIPFIVSSSKNTDTLLASVPNLTYLAPGQSYTNQVSVTLPAGVTGPYYIIVLTNAGDQVAEPAADLSAYTVSSVFPITLTPPPDLQVTKVIAAPEAFSGQPLTLGWTVQNNGQGPTGATTAWYDEILMSTDGSLDASAVILGTIAHTGSLAAGASYTASATVDLPIGVGGSATFYVVTDYLDQVYEGSVHANDVGSTATPTTVNITPPPDLQASVTSVPTLALADHTLNLTYQVTNVGATATPNTNWTDSVYLSTNNVLNSAATLVSSSTHWGALAVGQSYDVSTGIALPVGLSGTYYLIVQTDSADQVFEVDRSDATAVSAPINVENRPADLVVGSVNAPSTGQAGHQILVSWQVSNTGAGDTAGASWVDSIILSPSGVLGGADNIDLGNFANTGSLAAGASISRTAAVTLPITLNGAYTLFVETDAAKSVVESDDTNNASAGQSLAVTQLLADLQVASISAPGTATAGSDVTIGWTVDNAGDATTNANYWYDDVYVSSTPTLSSNSILLGQVQHVNALSQGGSYSASGTFILPSALSGGSYDFIVVADTNDQVTQTGYADDSATSSSTNVTALPAGSTVGTGTTSSGTTGTGTIGTGTTGTGTTGSSGSTGSGFGSGSTGTVIGVVSATSNAPPPDLVVSNVSAPADAISGQSFTVSYTVTNAGTTAASGWNNAVYLSANQVPGSNADVYLGYVSEGALAAGASVTVTKTFNIPNGQSGPFWVIVVADAGSTASTYAAAGLQVALPAVVDLSIGTVSVPATALVGSDANFVYTVTNTSTASEQGSWYDALYLSSDGTWSISDPLIGEVLHSGGIAGDGSYTGTLTAPVPGVTAGSYDVIVRTDIGSEDAGTNATGASNRAVAVGLPALTIGTPASGTLTTGGSVYYAVTVPAGQTLNLELSSDSRASVNNIYVRYGALPTTGQFDASSDAEQSANPNAIISATQPGTYYVLVTGDSVDGSETYSLTAQSLPFSITGITPDYGSDLGSVTVTINGAQFNANAVAEVIAPDGTIRAATKVSWVNSTEVTATFDLTGLAVGTYDVALIDGSQTTELPQSFEVNNGPAGQVAVNLVLPQYLRAGQTGVITVNYANTGNTDVQTPLIDVSSTQALIQLKGSAAGSYDIQFLGTSDTSAAGVLPPGAEGSASFAYTPVNPTPHEEIGFSVGTLDVGAGLADLTSTTSPTVALTGVIAPAETLGANGTIDWSSLESTLQPATVDATDWNNVWNNFVALVGDTTTSLQTALSQEASELSQIGEPTSDIATLLQDALFQASDSMAGTYLTTATDIAPNSSPLSLSLTRYYNGTLLARDAAGPFGAGWTFSYDITAVTDSSGNVYVQAPGALHVFTLQSNGTYLSAAGDDATLTETNGLYTMNDGSGDIDRFSANGQLSSITDSNGNVTALTYTGAGVLQAVTNQTTGETLTFTSNAQGLITRATDSDGYSVTYTYDSTGTQLLSATDPSGTTTYTYEPPPTKIIPFGNVTSIGNANSNALTSVTNPDGTQQLFTYDSQGRMASQSGAGGTGMVTYSYPSANEMTVTNALGEQMTLLFDANGNIAQTVDPQGNATELQYNSVGDLTGIATPGNSTSSDTYNSLGDLTSATDPLGGTTTATYAPGTQNLTDLTNQLGSQIHYSYDAAGDVTGITYQDGTGDTYQYNTSGLLTSSTDADGTTIAYSYNSDGELIGKTAGDGTSDTYIYDANGNMISATASGVGTTTYTYDSANRLTSVTNPAGQVESYTYNSLGKLASVTEPGGVVTQYSYNAAGQLSELQDGSGNLLDKYTYNAAGQLISTVTGNGASTSYQYDADGNVTQIQDLNADGSVASYYDYTYNANGLVATEDTSDGNWAYGYDASGELIDADFVSTNGTIANQSISYVYDAAGNRVSQTINGVTMYYTTNALNQYTAVGGTTYTYDADGNMTGEISSAGTTTFSYNADNQLVSENGPDGKYQYAYDALGNLVSETENGVTTNYVNNPLPLSVSGQPLTSVGQAYNASGALEAAYYYGLGLAAISDGAGDTSYVLSDANENVTGLSGSTGTLADTYFYLPFGEADQMSGASDNPSQFSGDLGITTVGGGLDLIRARFYDPSLGRFISIDPSGIAGGTNLYTYTDNDPVEYVDPTGKVLEVELTGNDFGEYYSGPLIDPETNYVYPYGQEPAGIVEILSDYTTQEQIFNALITEYSFIFGGIYSLDKEGTKGAYYFVKGFLSGYLDGPDTIPDNPPEGLGEFVGKLAKQLLDEKHSEYITPDDPNDILGPANYGDEQYISASAPLTYTINFENASTASAPAQNVTVTQQLDPNLNWNTFRLTGFGFDNLTYTLSGTQAFYSAQLNLEATKGYDVDVSAAVNIATGVVTWNFNTIAPTTGQTPLNPTAGFLPVNDANNDGDAFASYTIDAKSGLPSGTVVNAQATVVFDTQPPISTADIYDTLDTQAPTSQIEATPIVAGSGTYDVTWSGQDDPNGSGVADYNIYVSEDGGPATLWLTGTTLTEAIFTGEIGHTYTFSSVAIDNVGNIQAVVSEEPDIGGSNPPCYVRGTRIAVQRGNTSISVAVENLAIGDEVITVSGTAWPITWIGHRLVHCSRHPKPEQVWPIRVARDAFAAGQPSRDLYLSPDHAVFVAGCLVPIKHLVNGHSIGAVEVPEVQYWHIELAAHDILLAEDLPCESYLDTGNRPEFDNGGVAVSLHADFSAKSWGDACANLVQAGPLVIAEKRRLFDRAGIATQPFRPTLQVLCDGRPLRCKNVGRGLLSYGLPHLASDLQLISPPWVPACNVRESIDIRRLGVRLLQVRIDGQVLDLDDAAFARGFYPKEISNEGECRWTNGQANLLLPVGAKRITLRLADGATPYIATLSEPGGQQVIAC